MTERGGDDLSAVLGRAAAGLRRAGGLRQEDVADAARYVGLDWTRATVAAVELGRRRLGVEELLLLPSLLTIAMGEPVTLGDLLAVSPLDPVRLTPSLALPAGEVLDQLLLGTRAAAMLHSGDAPSLLERQAADRLGLTVEQVVALANALWGVRLHDERARRLDAVLAARSGDVEDRPRLADRLGRALVEELALARGGRPARDQPA